MFYPLSFRGKCAGRTQMEKSWCWPPINKLKAGYYLTVKYPFLFLCLVLEDWFCCCYSYMTLWCNILWYCLAGFWVTGYKRKLSGELSQPYFLWKTRILPFLACVRWCAFSSCADEWVTSVRWYGKLAAELGCERALSSLRKCGKSLAIARSLWHGTL